MQKHGADAEDDQDDGEESARGGLRVEIAVPDRGKRDDRGIDGLADLPSLDPVIACGADDDDQQEPQKGHLELVRADH